MYCKHQLLLARTYILGSNKQVNVIAMQPQQNSFINGCCAISGQRQVATRVKQEAWTSVSTSVSTCCLLVLDEVDDAVHES